MYSLNNDLHSRTLVAFRSPHSYEKNLRALDVENIPNSLYTKRNKFATRATSIAFMRFPSDTLRMPQLFELVILAFLLLISIELLLVYREVARLHAIRRPESKEEAAQPAGQTINVTVGAPAGGAAPMVVAADSKPQAESVLPRSEAPEPEEPDPPKPAILPSSTRATSSGLIAKKCPSCGNENSSYRSECYNCGAKL